MNAATLGDPVAIRQWVAAVALLAEAEEAAARGSSVDRAIALIAADTATEAALGLLSSRLAEELQSDSFGTYLARAKRVARLPSGLASEIAAVHRLRNNVVHNGAEASEREALRATLASRELLDVFVPRVLRAAKALGRGRGIGDAVGALLPSHPAGRALEAAQVALAKRDPKSALEECAGALEHVRRNTMPPLPVTRRRAPREVEIETKYGRTRTDYGFRQLDGALEALERWVVPLALGLSPAEYASLVEDLPYARSTGRSFEYHWSDEKVPDMTTAKRSLERVSVLVLRMWLTDRLRTPAPGAEFGW